MKKFTVGLITTMVLAVVIGGGVIIADDDKAEIEESVSLSARAFEGGGCDALHTCFLSGSSQVLIKDDQTRGIKGFVHLTSVKGPVVSGVIRHAVSMTVFNIAINEGSDGNVGTLTGGVSGVDSGALNDWKILTGSGHMNIVADESAGTIVLTLDTTTGTKTFFFGGDSLAGFPFAVVEISD